MKNVSTTLRSSIDLDMLLPARFTLERDGTHTLDVGVRYAS